MAKWQPGKARKGVADVLKRQPNILPIRGVFIVPSFSANIIITISLLLSTNMCLTHPRNESADNAVTSNMRSNGAEMLENDLLRRDVQHRHTQIQ